MFPLELLRSSMPGSITHFNEFVLLITIAKFVFYIAKNRLYCLSQIPIIGYPYVENLDHLPICCSNAVVGDLVEIDKI